MDSGYFLGGSSLGLGGVHRASTMCVIFHIFKKRSFKNVMQCYLTKLSGCPSFYFSVLETFQKRKKKVLFAVWRMDWKRESGRRCRELLQKPR